MFKLFDAAAAIAWCRDEDQTAIVDYLIYLCRLITP